ncbi:hypothetical protein [Prosthecobacter fluviatilis]|uniref:Uncharacterized protein n=1 Tax=Prosthecobacter fluviatilis TaxID=445931 RepID=A0ABW0KUF0_9BACT
MRNHPSKNTFEDSLFTLRFMGREMDVRGVSIYDLGLTFVAFQRIVNKTFLLTRSRLDKGAFPNWDERQMLALQIGQRKKASDGYGLIPILSDPSTVQILKFVGEQLMSGLMGYYVQDIMQRLKKEPDDDKRYYIGSIHAEVVNFVGRIDAAGGIGTVEIGAPGIDPNMRVQFSETTKNYVNKLSKEHFLGPKEIIRGKLLKMIPASGVIEIRRAGGGVVKVHVDTEIFEKVRFDKSRSDILEFIGRPIFPLGAKSQKVHELQATDVHIIASEEDDDKEGF